MHRQITPGLTPDHLRKEARRWLKALRAGEAAAEERYRRLRGQGPGAPTLREVQHALAMEFGLPGWGALKARVRPDAPVRRYEAVARALETAWRTGDPSAMRIVREYFGHGRSWAGLRTYVHIDLGRAEPVGEGDVVSLDDARELVARAQGFATWAGLMDYAAASGDDPADVASRALSIYGLAAAGERVCIERTHRWTAAFATLERRPGTGLDAQGQMTDALMDRLPRSAGLVGLDLGGSKALTDRGLGELRRFPELRRLMLGGSGISDRGLGVLRALPAMEALGLEWTGVTDAGVSVLADCDRLRRVDLTGTRTGDGAIGALAGKTRLHDFRSGDGVTDDGLSALHDLPVFRSWQGGEPRMGLTACDADPNYLLLRGRLTDAGMSRLVGLDGLFALNLDDARLGLTGAGLAPLAALPRLAWLAFDARDETMPHIAALPHLRFLMCQDTVAGDDGFVALSRSRTLAYIWGRRCHNLQRRGFQALAGLPALEALSVSCLNVDDAGLSALPNFPALKELMPMDVPDDGYRHIGRCAGLESLVLMYCRATTDEATRHIVGLPRLKRYFASYTRITDRTPDLLASMPSLEEITLDTCAGVTDAGIAALARLPRLRRLGLSGMPGVTRRIRAAFGPQVQVDWSP